MILGFLRKTGRDTQAADDTVALAAAASSLMALSFRDMKAADDTVALAAAAFSAAAAVYV